MFKNWLPELRKKKEKESGLDLWDDFFHAPFASPFFSVRPTPAVDMKETDDEITVSVDLPGIEPSDVELSIERDNLVIKGEKKIERESKGEDYLRRERSYGAFFRTVPLPAPVKREKVKAEYKKGVLKVSMPKDEKAKPKRISVSD